MRLSDLTLGWAASGREYATRPVRGNYVSVLGNRPCNDHGDIVRTTGIESILNKILGQLARRFHPRESLSDARIRDVPSQPVAAEEMDRPPGIRNPRDDGRGLMSADRAGEDVRQR